MRVVWADIHRYIRLFPLATFVYFVDFVDINFSE